MKLLFEIAAGWLVVVGFLGVLVVHSVIRPEESIGGRAIAAFGAVTRSVLKRPRNNRQADADLQ